jgi:hypothetical protein
MKNIITYISESLNNPSGYIRAKEIFEPIVKKALEDEGYTVKPGTQDEDFNHVDLVVSGKGTNFNVAVKANDEKNKNSKNFTFTIVSNGGKEYPFDKNNFFAFVDEITNEIYLVNQEDFYKRFAHYSKRNGKTDNSKWILVGKKDVAKLGRVISY